MATALTCVPEVNFVRSRVSPAGTSILSSTIVAQDFFDALTAEAAVNVHDAARLSRFASGEAVTAGAGTGLARVSDVKKIRARYRAIVVEAVKNDKD